MDMLTLADLATFYRSPKSRQRERMEYHMSQNNPYGHFWALAVVCAMGGSK